MEKDSNLSKDFLAGHETLIETAHKIERKLAATIGRLEKEFRKAYEKHSDRVGYNSGLGRMVRSEIDLSKRLLHDLSSALWALFNMRAEVLVSEMMKMEDSPLASRKVELISTIEDRIKDAKWFIRTDEYIAFRFKLGILNRTSEGGHYHFIQNRETWTYFIFQIIPLLDRQSIINDPKKALSIENMIARRVQVFRFYLNSDEGIAKHSGVIALVRVPNDLKILYYYICAPQS